MLQAESFTPSQTYVLDQIQLALSLHYGSSTTLTISLTTGLPGSTLESLSSSGITATPSIITFTSNSHPTLVSGQKYWIIAETSIPNSFLWYKNSIGDIGLHGISFGGWSTYSDTRGAFAVTGTSTGQPSGQGSCQVQLSTVFSQRDLRWATHPYNTTGVDNIGGVGCALTSLSMALNYAGLNTAPDTLNDFMDTVGGYQIVDANVQWDPTTSAVSTGSTSPFRLFPPQKLKFVSNVVNRSEEHTSE